MKLKSFQIKNYKSIKDLSFDIRKLDDDSFTYGLIGINEAGKSSVLQALALKDNLKDEDGNPMPTQKDFFNSENPIEVFYHYELESKELSECKKIIEEHNPDLKLPKNGFKKIMHRVYFDYNNPSQPQNKFTILDLSDDFEEKPTIEEIISPVLQSHIYKIIYWKAEKRFLISNPINLTQFADNPSNISIPLQNCFFLSGFNEIRNEINKLSDSTEGEYLSEQLGKKVTRHIKQVWKKHPIKITFFIKNDQIHFHVHDLKARGKAQTAGQRSDGFRQFISYLLTVSAKNKSKKLQNSILLLDEPEQHLHPQAQYNLLDELITITLGGASNIVFYATHSNYMIDRELLHRTFKVVKNNKITELSQFDNKNSTLASITYDVFGMSSSDYHNELYDSLRRKYADESEKDFDEIGIKEFDNGFFKQIHKQKFLHPFKGDQKNATLSTFVRNAIHYPENKIENFNKLLEESIEFMKTIK